MTIKSWYDPEEMFGEVKVFTEEQLKEIKAMAEDVRQFEENQRLEQEMFKEAKEMAKELTVEFPNLQSNTKETNPKDAIGIKKGPISTVSALVVAEMGVAMAEGALKYGRHNYRVAGIRASVYYDAAFRHLAKWWEGQDIDADSGLNHIVKALACLSVLRDSMLSDNWTDDRPPTTAPEGFWKGLDDKMKKLLEQYPNPVDAFIKGDEK